jgi:hypothetical protein
MLGILLAGICERKWREGNRNSGKFRDLRTGGLITEAFEFLSSTQRMGRSSGNHDIRHELSRPKPKRHDLRLWLQYVC